MIIPVKSKLKLKMDPYPALESVHAFLESIKRTPEGIYFEINVNNAVFSVQLAHGPDDDKHLYTHVAVYRSKEKDGSLKDYRYSYYLDSSDGVPIGDLLTKDFDWGTSSNATHNNTNNP